MGGKSVEETKYLECAKCEYLITCKIKADKANRCINFKERGKNGRLDKDT